MTVWQRDVWADQRLLLGVRRWVSAWMTRVMKTLTHLGDTSTWVVVGLALAHPDPASGVAGALAEFAAIFAVTQVPLAVSEGLLTVLVVRLLTRVSPAELARLGIRPARQEA